MKTFLIQCSNGKLSNTNFENCFKEKANDFLKTHDNMDDFLNSLNQDLKTRDKNLYDEYNEIRRQKIVNYNNRPTLDFKTCIPAYLRYLNDRLFYNIIFNQRCFNLENYIKFWQGLKNKDINVKIFSTLFGWVEYDDCIPDYHCPQNNWSNIINLNNIIINNNYAINLLSKNTLNNNFNKEYILGVTPDIYWGEGTNTLRKKARWFYDQCNL